MVGGDSLWFASLIVGLFAAVVIVMVIVVISFSLLCHATAIIGTITITLTTNIIPPPTHLQHPPSHLVQTAILPFPPFLNRSIGLPIQIFQMLQYAPNFVGEGRGEEGFEEGFEVGFVAGGGGGELVRHGCCQWRMIDDDDLR